MTSDYPFPAEIDSRILSFVDSHWDPELDDQDNKSHRFHSLISYSRVSRRFRALALPILFRRFDPGGEYAGQNKPKKFCQAWMARDPLAIKVSQHVTECIFRWKIGNVKRYWPPTTLQGIMPDYKSACRTYFQAFAMLPNLSSLTIAGNAYVDPKLLADVLRNTSIRKLVLERGLGGLSAVATRPGTAPRGPFGYDEDAPDIARNIAELAISLQELQIHYDAPVGQLLFFGNLELSFITRLRVLKIHDCGIIDLHKLRIFLSGMSSLEVFKYTKSYELRPLTPPLSSSDLPYLRTLTCPVSWVPSFVANGRNIWKLDVLPNKPVSPDARHHIQHWSGPFVDSVSRAGGEIRWMRLPALLAVLPFGQLVPQLETLLISFTPTRWSEDADEEATERLRSLEYHSKIVHNIVCSESNQHPKLRELVLEDGIHSSDLCEYRLNLLKQEEDIEALAARFPSLTRVILAPDIRWDRRELKGRWSANIIEDKKHDILYELNRIRKNRDQYVTWINQRAGGFLVDMLEQDELFKIFEPVIDGYSDSDSEYWD